MIDAALVGSEIATVSFPLERGKLAELGRALHDEDPVWHDPAAARAAGFDAVPVLPTAAVLADHWRPDGALFAAVAIGADVRRVLHGEVSWEYLRPLRVGERLTAVSRVADVAVREGARGGRMTLVTIETDVAGADGEVAVRRRDVLIETGERA